MHNGIATAEDGLAMTITMSNTAVTNTTINVTVRKKDGIIFQGTAFSVTSTNEKGTFDVLPQHTNFIAVINNTLTIRPVDTTRTTISIPRGIIHVKQNAIEVFVGV